MATADPQASISGRGRRTAVTRAAVLILGAVAVLLLVEAVGVRFFWVPSMLGLTYLLSAAAGRSAGPLWAPGCVLTAVGLTEALWFQAGRPADSFVFAQLTLLAAGTGALLAVLMRGVGVHVSAMGLAVSVLLTGAFNLAEAKGVRYVAGDTWLYAGLLAAFGLFELARASQRGSRR